MISFRSSASLFLGVLCIQALAVGGFLVRKTSNSMTRRVQTSQLKMAGVLYDPRTAESEPGSEFVEFPTPRQRIELKKAASKRQARKQLVSFSLPAEETSGPFSQETLEQIGSLLNVNELVLVRGISKNQIKSVFGTAERLGAEVEMTLPSLPCEEGERTFVPTVALLSTKGHTALFYSPLLPLDHPLHVPIRTSVGQKNTWTARDKAPRDNRGQIIRD